MRRSGRSGLTFVEVLVAIVLLGIIVLVIASNAGWFAAKTTSTIHASWQNPASFIPSETTKEYTWFVSRTLASGSPMVEKNRQFTFAATGGLTVTPASAATDDNGIITVKVTAPKGQGTGTLVATDVTSGNAETPLTIEYGPGGN